MGRCRPVVCSVSPPRMGNDHHATSVCEYPPPPAGADPSGLRSAPADQVTQDSCFNLAASPCEEAEAPQLWKAEVALLAQVSRGVAKATKKECLFLTNKATILLKITTQVYEQSQTNPILPGQKPCKTEDHSADLEVRATPGFQTAGCRTQRISPCYPRAATRETSSGIPA